MKKRFDKKELAFILSDIKVNNRNIEAIHHFYRTVLDYLDEKPCQSKLRIFLKSFLRLFEIDCEASRNAVKYLEDKSTVIKKIDHQNRFLKLIDEIRVEHEKYNLRYDYDAGAPEYEYLRIDAKHDVHRGLELIDTRPLDYLVNGHITGGNLI